MSCVRHCAILHHDLMIPLYIDRGICDVCKTSCLDTFGNQASNIGMMPNGPSVPQYHFLFIDHLPFIHSCSPDNPSSTLESRSNGEGPRPNLIPPRAEHIEMGGPKETKSPPPPNSIAKRAPPPVDIHRYTSVIKGPRLNNQVH